MKAQGQYFFAAFLVFVAAYAIFAASRWSFKAGFFPLAVAIPLLILTLTHLLLEWFGQPDTKRGPAVEAEFSVDVAPEIARRRVLVLFSWMAGFIVSVYFFGFPLTVPLFVFLYLKLQGDVSWTTTIVLTLLTWGLFHGLFERLVRIQFEPGAVQLWLGL
jgi:hypothetical protein